MAATAPYPGPNYGFQQSDPTQVAFPNGPGGYAPPPASGPNAPSASETPVVHQRARRRKLLIGVAALAVIVVAVAGFLVAAFVTPGFLDRTELDVTAVNAGVQQVLTDGYHAGQVTDVQCNGGTNPSAEPAAM